jgi:hypothetical protein
MIVALPSTYRLFPSTARTSSLVPWLKQLVLHRSRSELVQLLHPLLGLSPQVGRQINSLCDLSSLFLHDDEGDSDITEAAMEQRLDEYKIRFDESECDGTIDIAAMRKISRSHCRSLLIFGDSEVAGWSHAEISANVAVNAPIVKLTTTDPKEYPALNGCVVLVSAKERWVLFNSGTADNVVR